MVPVSLKWEGGVEWLDMGASTWSASKSYAAGDLVIPTTANGHYYECTTTGTSDTSEPSSWPIDGSTVNDGTTVWKDMGLNINNTAMGDHYDSGELANSITNWTHYVATFTANASTLYISLLTDATATTNNNNRERFDQISVVDVDTTVAECSTALKVINRCGNYCETPPMATPSTWTASTPYSVGALVYPATANGRYYRCISGGTSDSSEPTWPTDRAQVTDNDVIWEDMGSTGWSAATSYFTGDFVTPTTVNGHYYRCVGEGASNSSEPSWPTDRSQVTDGTVIWEDMGAPVSTWTPETSYAVGDLTTPTVDKERYYRNIKSGTSSTNEPTWSTDVTGLVEDGTAQWQYLFDSYDADLDTYWPSTCFINASHALYDTWNDWKELIFFQTAPGWTAGGGGDAPASANSGLCTRYGENGCLTLCYEYNDIGVCEDSDNGFQALVILGDQELDGQDRAAQPNTVGNYLEGGNVQDMISPDLELGSSASPAGDPFNDSVVCVTDDSTCN